MNERDFKELLGARFEKGNFLCVGLDSDLEKIPPSIEKKSVRETLVAFNRAIIDATHDLVCAYKPNSAFYEAHGDEGMAALRETNAYIHDVAPDVPIILDAKRADIGNTNKGYVDAAFEFALADAITVHPYLGREALAPFLEQKKKGVFVLCRTSNAGAGEVQDLLVEGEPLYKKVAKLVAEEWNTNDNCGLVVGATYPKELKEVRHIIGGMPILIPGVGAQGGDIHEAVVAAKDSNARGFIVSVSRAILFASGEADFADKARAQTIQFDRAIRDALV